MLTQLLIDFINGEEIGYQTLAQLNKFERYIKGLIRPGYVARFHENYNRTMESEVYGIQIFEEEISTNHDTMEQKYKTTKPWYMDYMEFSINSLGLQIFKCKLCSLKVRHETLDLYMQHIQSTHNQVVEEQLRRNQDEEFSNETHQVFACNDKTAELNNADSSLNSGISLLHATDPEETSLMLPKVISKPPNSCMPRSPSQSDLIKKKKKKKRTSGQCDVCNRSFNDLYNLRIHKMIHTDEKPFQCETCGKRFRQYNKLKIHCITHTNLKPYTCNICNKGFRFRNYLSVHKRLHSTEKPYKCKFCDELFHSLHSRRLHAKMMHCEAKTFNCPICSKILTAQCYLTAHMKRHTNQRDYKCSTCDKCFFSQSQLKDHQLVHTNLKPYKCEVCNACFQRKSNYTQHSKIHTGEKSYICHICKKSFAQNAGLYGHMKSHARC